MKLSHGSSSTNHSLCCLDTDRMHARDWAANLSPSNWFFRRQSVWPTANRRLGGGRQTEYRRYRRRQLSALFLDPGHGYLDPLRWLGEVFANFLVAWENTR